MRTHRHAGFRVGLGWFAAAVVAAPLLAAGLEPDAPQQVAGNGESQPPRTRSFHFNYAATLSGVSAGSEVQVWLPVPPSNDEQSVEIVSQELPAEASLGFEAKYGNRMLHLRTTTADDKPLSLRVVYQVERREVRTMGATAVASALTKADREQFLGPDALVPIDGKPLRLLEQLALAHEPLLLARQLYDRVGEHMTYKKEGTGWGEGDVLWACDSQYGNCTDFHSLFISLARSQGLPARFEMGFPLPAQQGEGKIAGYHCWAWFYAEQHGWVPVDISEADKHPELTDYYFGSLTEDRVAFSMGRDLVLEPPQQGPKLNYFIYPYAEVDGKPQPKSAFKPDFSYQDQ